MILYILEGCGVFGEECAKLPVTLYLQPAPDSAMLDGKPLRLTGGRVEIPSTIPAGMHTLTVEGRVVPFRVREGQLCATQTNWRCLLPTLARICELEKRVAEQEKTTEENQVDWLK